MHLLRHLQILMASFRECFSSDCVTKLKDDHFCDGMPKWLKVMVAYFKASANEKTYSDYLQAGQESEKEEAMEHCQHKQTQCNELLPSTEAQRQSANCYPFHTGGSNLEEESTEKGKCIDSED